MSVREYIGARYIPVLADPMEWDSTKNYEPLTIVLHNGNSFTSRQYVPAGGDINNTDYWAPTGVYNAQIEQYRQEVRAFDGRITTAQDRADEAYEAVESLEGELGSAAYKNFTSAVEDSSALPISSAVKSRIDTVESSLHTSIDSAYQELNTKINNVESNIAKRVAIIGDSYTSDANYYRNKLNPMLPSNVDIDYFGLGGVGFVRETVYGNGHNFTYLLNQALTSGKVYDQIIFYGGINDCSSMPPEVGYSASNPWGYIDPNDIQGAVVNLKSIIASSSSNNAEIVIVPNEKKWDAGHSASVPYTFYYQGIENGAMRNGWRYVKSGRFWIWFTNNGYDNDGIHPSDNGAKAIATMMLDVINGGNPSISYRWYEYKSGLDCGDYQGNCSVAYHFDDGKLTLELTFGAINKKVSATSRNFLVARSNFANFVIPTYFVGGYVPVQIFAMGATFGSIANSYIASGDDNIFYCAFLDGGEPRTTYEKFRIGVIYDF